MSATAAEPRLQVALARLDGWADRTRLRRVLVTTFVTVTAPLVVIAGIAMLVLPGPGLVTIAAGFSLLAVAFPWARQIVARAALFLSQVRQFLLPPGASPARRMVGVTVVVGFFVSTTAATAGVSAWLGAQALL